VDTAATLVAHGIRSSQYKVASQRAERREIRDALQAWIWGGQHVNLIEEEADALEAVASLLADTSQKDRRGG